MNTDSGMMLENRIIELYGSEKGLALRYVGIANRLAADPEQVREVCQKLVERAVLHRGSGYYQLNPRELWKTNRN